MPILTPINIYIYIYIYIDDVVKITSEPHNPRALEARPAQQKREDLTESTGVVPAKYPPKVKLEIFSPL